MPEVPQLRDPPEDLQEILLQLVIISLPLCASPVWPPHSLGSPSPGAGAFSWPSLITSLAAVLDTAPRPPAALRLRPGSRRGWKSGPPLSHPTSIPTQTAPGSLLSPAFAMTSHPWAAPSSMNSPPVWFLSSQDPPPSESSLHRAAFVCCPVWLLHQTRMSSGQGLCFHLSNAASGTPPSAELQDKT